MPQYLERDPNALSILLRGQSQIPRYTEEEYDLQSMIPEEQLFEAQDAISERGRQSGGPYSVPSRESLQQSGMAKLRQMFGINRAEGQAKAYPNQVAGEYGLQEARIKGGFDVESARQKALADAAEQTAQQGFQSRQQADRLAQDASEGALNRGVTERNTQAQIGGRENVANIGAGSRAATQKALDLRKSGGENNYWGPEGLMASLPDPLRRLFLAGADSTKAAPTASSATAPVSPAAAELAPLMSSPKYSTQPFEALLQQGIVSGSPEEIAEYRQIWESR